MVVMILESCPPGLRGELTRWLLEPHAGVFVGKVSALVRDKLWELCTERRGAKGVIQIWDDANEQGFSLRSFGDTVRHPVYIEGLWFMLEDISEAARKEIKRKLR